MVTDDLRVERGPGRHLRLVPVPDRRAAGPAARARSGLLLRSRDPVVYKIEPPVLPVELAHAVGRWALGRLSMPRRPRGHPGSRSCSLSAWLDACPCPYTHMNGLTDRQRRRLAVKVVESDHRASTAHPPRSTAGFSARRGFRPWRELQGGFRTDQDDHRFQIHLDIGLSKAIQLHRWPQPTPSV